MTIQSHNSTLKVLFPLCTDDTLLKVHQIGLSRKHKWPWNVLLPRLNFGYSPKDRVKDISRGSSSALHTAQVQRRGKQTRFKCSQSFWSGESQQRVLSWDLLWHDSSINLGLTVKVYGDTVFALSRSIKIVNVWILLNAAAGFLLIWFLQELGKKLLSCRTSIWIPKLRIYQQIQFITGA